MKRKGTEGFTAGEQRAIEICRGNAQMKKVMKEIRLQDFMLFIAVIGLVALFGSFSGELARKESMKRSTKALYMAIRGDMENFSGFHAVQRTPKILGIGKVLASGF